MRLSDRANSPRRITFDWRGWMMVAWAFPLGLLYARMVLETKMPGFFAACRTSLAQFFAR